MTYPHPLECSFTAVDHTVDNNSIHKDAKPHPCAPTAAVRAADKRPSANHSCRHGRASAERGQIGPAISRPPLPPRLPIDQRFPRPLIRATSCFLCAFPPLCNPQSDYIEPQNLHTRGIIPPLSSHEFGAGIDVSTFALWTFNRRPWRLVGLR